MKAVFFTFLIVSLVAAQSFMAVRIDEEPVIDGVLDDHVWEYAETQTVTFYQYGPLFGELMTEPTEIRIIYDEKNIYFGFILFDCHPDIMNASLTARDVYLPGEWIAILLDTYNDGREASSFEVNLANSQMDSKIDPFGFWDYSWDAVWKSETSIIPCGWSAEFCIPLSCLRFSDDSVQTWAVNFQRVLNRTNENGWCVLSRGNDQADIDNFAVLEGLYDLEKSLGIELRSYAAGRIHYTGAEDLRDEDLEAGIDVKLGISSEITADLTVNPDFGQIEADEEEMNLSYFELFLREKRPFFLESRDVFNMPFNLFYSRRVGAVASNGEVIPILGGAKVSGTLGSNFQFGLLDAVTARVWEDGELVEPAANFGILRIRRNFSSMGYLGISAVSREVPAQEELDGEYNRAFAVDTRIELPGDHILSGAVAGSWNSLEDDGSAYNLYFGKLGQDITYNLESTYLTEDFNVNGTGFTTVTGQIESSGNIRYTFRPDRLFTSYSPFLNCWYNVTRDGVVTGRGLMMGSNFRLRNNCRLHGHIGASGSRFESYEGPEGRNYDGNINFWVDGSTNWNSPVSLWAGVGGGQSSHEGIFGNYNASLTFRPFPSLWISTGGEFFRTTDENRYNWETGNFDKRDTEWKSFLIRGNYMFSPNLNLRLFMQYSHFSSDYTQIDETVSKQFRTNILFSWQFQPGSTLYILFEDILYGDGTDVLKDPDYGFFSKITWFFPF